MKFKQNWKRFWTLNRHHAEGFTLVELIVVIAVLAILGGVAVPAYSGYITRANKQADISLVSEVSHALTLQYYANTGDPVADYVVLSPTADAVAGGEFATAAMLAVFGEGWEETAKLKYDGWTDTTNVSDSNVLNSTYMKKTSPSEMMATVSDLTGALSGLAKTASKDPLETLQAIGQLSDEQAAAIKKNIGDEYGLEFGEAGYDTVLANSLVKYVMDDLGTIGKDGKAGPDSSLSTLVVAYASMYAWSKTSDEGAAAMDTLNTTILDENANSSQIVGAIMDTFGNLQGNADFQAYYDENGNVDDMALVAIMGTASQVSKDFDMTQDGLYASDDVGNTLNNYFNAVKSVSGMENPPVVGNGDILVFVNSDGTILTQFTD